MTDHLVIDASVLIQAYVKEVNTDNVLEMLDRLQRPSDLTLHAPEFCAIECTNILWQHVRRHGMPVAVAQVAVKDILDLPLTIHLAASYLPDALAVGLELQLAIYDSIYIALAKSLGFPLVTVDLKQERAAIAAGIRVKSIFDFKSAS
jgi:predicted nucleic acid-binding protein